MRHFYGSIRFSLLHSCSWRRKFRSTISTLSSLSDLPHSVLMIRHFASERVEIRQNLRRRRFAGFLSESECIARRVRPGRGRNGWKLAALLTVESSDLGQGIIEWRECSVSSHLFNGALYVMGEGDLYVMATKEEQDVSAYEVIAFGSFIGTFDQEAVKLHMKLKDNERHRYHAVIKHKEQVFGPFSEVC